MAAWELSDLADPLSLYGQSLHLGEVVVVGSHIRYYGLLIWLVHVHIWREREEETERERQRQRERQRETKWGTYTIH